LQQGKGNTAELMNEKDQNYFETFGITMQQMRERMAMLGLGEADHQLCEHLHARVLRPHAKDIIDQFYRLLLQSNEVTKVLKNHHSLEKLKRTQTQYLNSLGRNFDQQPYIESRLRIGMAHVYAGVGLSVYMCAYRILQQLIIDLIPMHSSKRDILIAYILKITFFDMSLAIECYHNAQIFGLVGALKKIQHKAERLEVKLQKDGLTRLLTRESIFALIKRKQEENEAVHILMSDLDHFKQVNDQYGHLVGDEVLREVARRIKHATRENDAVGRFGGEEFIIVIAQTTNEKACIIAERIRTEMENEPIIINELELTITISIGLALLEPHADMSQILDKADQLMYKAKTAGRNRVEVDDVVRS